MNSRICALFFCFSTLLTANALAQSPKELRAVWIATVDNIDWPTRGNYNADSQKAEFRKILDQHQRNGMNAVVVQIRPCTDAFYPSPYEPWSEWLTGKQGRPPAPYYDPLEFMIEETHRRGMEFHAWCNPYRAVFSTTKSSISPTHITRIHPEWFLTYGTTRYFDPGNKEAQQYVVRVIRDIVSRYEVDAIHFDDYFYPYRIAGKQFPDDASYARYGNGLSLEDWRRSNTDSIILLLSRAIKAERKTCRFGISPFGVWRNNTKDSIGSATHAGTTNYDDLYADIVLWLKQGWIDYVAPQLYWEFNHPVVPFDLLLNWWAAHSYGRQCFIGLGIYKAGSNAAWRDKTQLPRMVQAIRETPNVSGAIYFSSKSFDRNPNGWSDSLRENYYRYPALIPAMPWVDSSTIAAPAVRYIDFSVTAADSTPGKKLAPPTIRISNTETVKKIKAFAVYAAVSAPDNNREDINAAKPIAVTKPEVRVIAIIPAADGTADYTVPAGAALVGISCVDFENNESPLTPVHP